MIGYYSAQSTRHRWAQLHRSGVDRVRIVARLGLRRHREVIVGFDQVGENALVEPAQGN